MGGEEARKCTSMNSRNNCDSIKFESCNCSKILILDIGDAPTTGYTRDEQH